MKRDLQHVPYGYEPPTEKVKGTLIYYDAFAGTAESELDRVLELKYELGFAKLVLYPLHEETLKRMTKESAEAYHKREKPLLQWTGELNRRDVTVESWEGKRKKYTPMEAALRHLIEKYPGPHFIYLSPETANLFASYSSFEEWIGKVRLILATEPATLHPRLERYAHRWHVGIGVRNPKDAE